MLDGKVAQGQGHRVSREDVVAAEDVFPIDGQAAARYDCKHSVDIHHRCRLVPRRLGHAGVGLVRLGQNSNAHGERPVVVEESKDQPDAPEDDGAVGVKHDDEDSQEGVRHEDHLGHIEAPVLVVEGVKEEVREGFCFRNPLVGEGKAERGGEEAGAKEDGCEESLQRLARDPS